MNMRYFFTLLATASLSLVWLTGTASAAEHSGYTATSNLAPADEYFGRYHMSILGIRNTIHDFNTKVANNPDGAAAYIGGIALTEDAVRAWGTKYPHDPMLATASLGIERLYLRIGGDDGRDRAADIVTWVDTVLPHDTTSRMAHVLLAEQTTTPAENVSSVMPPTTDQSENIVQPATEVSNVTPPTADDQSTQAPQNTSDEYSNDFHSSPTEIIVGSRPSMYYGP
jgi:hypothetical protein